MSEREKVAIIGGRGNMGRVTEKLAARAGFDPVISDISDPETPAPEEAIKTSKIIFFSVLPIEEIPKIINATADQIDAGYVIIDNATVKQPLSEVYKKLDQEGVSICSTHPLCKHDQPLKGQKVLIMNVGSNHQKASDIANKLYQNAEMVTIPFEFDQHDASMEISQSPHLFMRSIAQIFAESQVDLETLWELAPANTQLFLLSLSRTLIQDPKISATIIHHQLSQDSGKELVDLLESSIEEIKSVSTDQNKLTENLAQTRTKLDKNDFFNSMNEITTTVLERLANLELQSLTVISNSDDPGDLRKLLEPFEKLAINLTAIDSHSVDGGIKFEIGIDQKTISEENLAQLTISLTELGFRVEKK